VGSAGKIDTGVMEYWSIGLKEGVLLVFDL
jgi:hypothetical protein